MSFDLSKCQKNEQGQPICVNGNNEPIRIVCTDAKGCQPLVAMVLRCGVETEHRYHRDGRFCEGRSPTEYDLKNIPQRVKRWVNFSSGGACWNYDSEFGAREMARINEHKIEYLAIAVPVEFEVRG